MHGRLIALGHAGRANPAALDVIGLHRENLPLVMPRRESGEAMVGPRRRVRAAVQKNLVASFGDLAVYAHRRKLLVERIALLENTVVARRDKHIGRYIARALLLTHR